MATLSKKQTHFIPTAASGQAIGVVPGEKTTYNLSVLVDGAVTHTGGGSKEPSLDALGWKEKSRDTANQVHVT